MVRLIKILASQHFKTSDRIAAEGFKKTFILFTSTRKNQK